MGSSSGRYYYEPAVNPQWPGAPTAAPYGGYGASGSPYGGYPQGPSYGGGMGSPYGPMGYPQVKVKDVYARAGVGPGQPVYDVYKDRILVPDAVTATRLDLSDGVPDGRYQGTKIAVKKSKLVGNEPLFPMAKIPHPGYDIFGNAGGYGGPSGGYGGFGGVSGSYGASALPYTSSASPYAYSGAAGVGYAPEYSSYGGLSGATGMEGYGGGFAPTYATGGFGGFPAGAASLSAPTFSLSDPSVGFPAGGFGGGAPTTYDMGGAGFGKYGSQNYSGMGTQAFGNGGLPATSNPVTSYSTVNADRGPGDGGNPHYPNTRSVPSSLHSLVNRQMPAAFAP